MRPTPSRTELQAGTGATSDALVTPTDKSPQDPRFVDRRPAVGEAPRQPPRRDLPRRALQRQQRARRRLLDERAHDRARRLDGRTSPTRSSSAPAAMRATTSSTATRSRTCPSHSTGRRRSRASGRRSSQAPATSTATPTSSSTASGSTATSRASFGPAPGAVSVGEALVKAKLDYLAATPDMRGLHEKALLEAARVRAADARREHARRAHAGATGGRRDHPGAGRIRPGRDTRPAHLRPRPCAEPDHATRGHSRTSRPARS